MAIKFRCLHCDTPFSISDKSARRLITCPGCRSSITVPAPATETDAGRREPSAPPRTGYRAPKPLVEQESGGTSPRSGQVGVVEPGSASAAFVLPKPRRRVRWVGTVLVGTFVVGAMFLAVVLIAKLSDRGGAGHPLARVLRNDGPAVPIAEPADIPAPKGSGRGNSTTARTTVPPAPNGERLAEERVPPVKKEMPRDMQRLVDDLKGKDAKAKVAALSKLRDMGEHAGPAAEAICNCLIDPSDEVVLVAFEAIEKVRPDLCKPLSKLILEYGAREKAAVVLGAMGTKAAPAKCLLITCRTA